MTLLITDVDDTILQCANTLQRYLAEDHGLVADKHLRDHHNIPNLYGLDIARTLELIAEFHRSHWMDKLPVEPCASVVLPELHRRGYRFVAITACLNEPETVQARLRNLKDAFGFEWEAVHCLGITPSKVDALKMYPPSIWVDDLGRHAADGAELGHRSFLIDKPYNRHENHARVVRVVDWYELLYRLES